MSHFDSITRIALGFIAMHVFLFLLIGCGNEAPSPTATESHALFKDLDSEDFAFIRGSARDVVLRVRSPDTGSNLLAAAIETGHLGVVDYLCFRLRKNTPRAFLREAACVAVVIEDTRAFDIMMHHFSDSSDVWVGEDFMKGSPIHYSARSETDYFIAQIIDTFPGLVDACTYNVSTADECVTPLILAVNARRTEIIRMLVEAGADVNRGSANGSGPLAHACSYGDLDVARLLFDAGADPDLKPDRSHSITARERAEIRGDAVGQELLRLFDDLR